MGTHNDVENREDTLDVYRVRVPKITQSSKTVIDYSTLNPNTHSKLEKVKSITHENEVMKCRQNPFDESLIASNITTGAINLYKMDQKE